MPRYYSGDSIVFFTDAQVARGAAKGFKKLSAKEEAKIANDVIQAEKDAEQEFLEHSFVDMAKVRIALAHANLLETVNLFAQENEIRKIEWTHSASSRANSPMMMYIRGLLGITPETLKNFLSDLSKVGGDPWQ